jgi:signal peptidase I
VLTSPVDGEVLLKRVVATPGDLVQVWDGRVFIDGYSAPWQAAASGEAIEKLGGVSHRVGTSFGGGPDFGPITVPPDAFLVLGDNRGNSNDGRSFGWVARGAILGKAVAVCVHDDSPVWKGL